jgi:molecular chaperone GrpE|tara:strand:+ start:926 stop:1486 length:561 start_codon:yes stop_codon:yes gene_type:complete
VEQIEMNSEPDRDDEERVAEEAGEEVVAEIAEDIEVDELTALQVRVDENWDKYLRTAAELENVRKRAARDVEKAHKFAVERFATDILAVCDSLEMALATEGDVSVDSLREGNEATLKLLGSVLSRFSVEELDPHGEPFDPELHEAMTMQPSEEVEPGTVVTVIQKGYALNGRLLRPARVVVASEPS